MVERIKDRAASSSGRLEDGGKQAAYETGNPYNSYQYSPSPSAAHLRLPPG